MLLFKIKFNYPSSQILDLLKPRGQQLNAGQLLTVLKYNIFISNLVSFASFITMMVKKNSKSCLLMAGISLNQFNL
jgi:hypothetical protein